MSEEGELELKRSDGTIVRVNVDIVDEIITTKKQDEETASRFAHYSASILSILLGQNLRDFFPVAIEKIHGGLHHQDADRFARGVEIPGFC